MTDSLRFHTGEIDLAYSEWPGRGPPIVCLHGISGTRSLLLVEAAGEGRHRYAYDARGHGESGRAATYRFADYGRDAVAFVRGAVGEPAVLLGHSLGGMTAIYAAAHCPELVLGAFLVDPPLYAPHTGLRFEKEPFAAVRAQAGLPVEELIARGVPAERAPAISKLDPAVMAQTLDGTFGEGWDTDAFLSRIECPVLLQHGDRELGSAIYPGEIERAAARLKRGRIERIAGTGHAPWLQAREEFEALVRRFLEEVAPV